MSESKLCFGGTSLIGDSLVIISRKLKQNAQQLKDNYKENYK